MANQRWTADKNIQFINEYQRSECLWDPKHPHYKSRDAREAAYKAIMEVMQMESVKDVVGKIRILRNTYNNKILKAKKFNTKSMGTDELYVSKIPWLAHMDFLKNIDSYKAVVCKQRCQSLRDEYRTLFKRKRKVGQAAKNIKQWKYENEMEFVAPVCVSHDSVDMTSDYEIADNANDKRDANIIPNEERHNEPQTINLNKLKVLKRKADRSEQASPLISEHNKFEPPRGHDELDRFFLHISDTVKKFTPYEQALAKNKIFSIVSEMELQQLAPHTSPQVEVLVVKRQCPSPDNWNDETQ